MTIETLITSLPPGIVLSFRQDERKLVRIDMVDIVYRTQVSFKIAHELINDSIGQTYLLEKLKEMLLKLIDETIKGSSK